MDDSSITEPNGPDRFHDVFFYGLYMDPNIVLSKGGQPRNSRKATVKNYRLRVGKLATLLRANGFETSGMVYSLTHGELDAMYRGSGLTQHLPEALMAELETGERIPVLSYNLLTPPEDTETNPEYLEKLVAAKSRLGLG